MRWIFGAITLVITALACNSNADPSNENGAALPGVKDTFVMMETVRYNMQQQPFMRSLFTYNKQGNLTKEVLWDSSGMGVRIQNRYVEYKDSLPNIVRLKDPDGNQVYQINYSYNEQGKMIEEVYQDDAGSTRKIQKYDDRGNPIEVTTIDQSGTEQRSVYTYNAANKIDTAISYLPNGKRQQMNVYRYKKDTLMTDCLFVDENDSIYLHWTYSYNKDGKLESEYEKAANGTQYVIKRYFFNEEGLKVREEGYKGRMYTTHFMYDTAGNLREQRVVDNSGIIRSRAFFAPLSDQHK